MNVEFGAWSLLPPIAAIVLAIATRRVVPSLLVGIIVGFVILTVGNELASDRPGTTAAAGVRRLAAAESPTIRADNSKSLADWVFHPVDLAEQFLWQSLVDESHLRVFAFTMLMGAMVLVMQKSGGMHALVDRLAPLARSRRGGQLTTWLLGLIVFFDDYANTLLLGNTMRPLADRLRISREKLAYLVDSTAAPVSGIVIISTWVAGEIGYINDGLKGLEFTQATSGFELFMASIPYRFYVVFALILVPIIGLLGRDFGPMLNAERKAANRKPPESPNRASDDKMELGHWSAAVVPVAAMIGVTVLLLLVTGTRELRAQQAEEAKFTFWNVFSNGDSYLALVYGSLAGLLVALGMAYRANAGQLGAAALSGARSVLPALVILWLAWTLSRITESEFLGTGDYLGGLLEKNVPLALMPTLVFVLASFVAFATGTSWGTMGILMPLVVPTVFQMLTAESHAVSPANSILIGCIGSVLAGAIFGDHCSPISDTTVLSSQASGCDHVAHVQTQLPYALLSGAVAIAFGTLPVGFGVSPWLMLPLGVVVLVVSMFLIGRRVEDS